MNHSDHSRLLIDAIWAEARGALDTAADLINQLPQTASLEDRRERVRRKQAAEANSTTAFHRARAALDNDPPQYARAREACAQAREQALIAGTYRIAGPMARMETLIESLATHAVRVTALEDRVAAAIASQRHDLIDSCLSECIALPTAPEAAPLQYRLETLLRILIRQLDDTERVDRARWANRNADYAAVRLFLDPDIPIQSPSLQGDADYYRSYAQRTIDRQITPVTDALAQAHAGATSDDWQRARTALERVGGDYRGSPAIQRVRRDISLGVAFARLDAAETVLLDHPPDFARAERLANEVRQQLERERSDDVSIHLLEQADALAAVLALAQRALSAIQLNQAADALSYLESATARAELARSQGRPLSGVEQIVQAVADELRIKTAARQDAYQILLKVETALEQGDLEQALRLSEPLVINVGGSAYEQARTVQERVHKRLQSHNAALEYAQRIATTELSKALDITRDALRAWPRSPEAINLLEALLVQAGEAALQTGEDRAALAAFDEALVLNPRNEHALHGRNRCEESTRVEGEITALRGQLLDLQQQPPATIEAFRQDYDPLISHLAQLTTTTSGATQTRVRELATLARQLGEGVTTYIQERAAAEAALQIGNWPTAVAAITRATASLQLPNTPPPDTLITENNRWSAAGAQIDTATRRATSLFREAQQTFAEAATSVDIARVQALLTELATMLHTAAEAAQSCGGNLPPELHTLTSQIDAFQVRVAAAVRAFELPDAAARAAAARLAAKELNDPTLTDLAERFDRERVNDRQKLLEQADIASTDGDYENELSLLSQLIVRYGETLELLRRRDRAAVNLRLLRAIDSAKAVAQLSTTTTTSARDALRASLRVLLDPTYQTPEAIQQPIRDLLALAEQSGEDTRFDRDEIWKAAQGLRMRLISVEDGLARHVTSLVDRWLNLEREAAVSSIVATAAALGNVMRAYAAALAYRVDNPDNERAFELLLEAQTQLRASVVANANKQISRAEELRDQGEPREALNRIEDLFTDTFDPLTSIYPGLLERLDSLDSRDSLVRQFDKAALLRDQCRDLATLADEVDELLKQAEEHSRSGDYPASAQLLQQLPNLSRLPNHAARADSLRNDNAATWTVQANAQLSLRLEQLALTLTQATTLETYDQVLSDLKALLQDDLMSRATEDTRQRREVLWQQTSHRRALLAKRSEWLAEADAADAEADLDREISMLKFVIEATYDVIEQTRLKQRQNNRRQILKQCQNIQQLLETGLTRIEQRAFDLACNELSSAVVQFNQLPQQYQRLFGIDPPTALNTARAGQLFVEAQEIWATGRSLRNGQSKIERALSLLSNSRDAALHNECLVLKQQFSERLGQLNSTVQTAQAAFRNNDILTAQQQIEFAQGIDPQDPDIDQLRKLIESGTRQRQKEAEVLSLLRQADQERRRNNDERALELLKRVLELAPENTIARSQREELEKNLSTNSQLRAVQQLIYMGKFRRAHQEFSALSQVLLPNQLEELQRLLADQETFYRRSMINPAREDVRAARFSEALDRLDAELRREAHVDPAKREFLSDELLGEMLELHRSIGEQALTWARERMTNAQTPDDFALIEQRLSRLTNRTDLPDRQALMRLARQARAGKLNTMLELVELALDYRLDPPAASMRELSDAKEQQLRSAPSDLDEAVHRVNDVLADAVDLPALDARARGLLTRIRHQVAIQAEASARDELSARLDPLRRLLEQALRHNDPSLSHYQLEKAQHDVLALQKYDDPEVATLHERIGKALTLLERTQKTLTAVREQLLDKGNPTAARNAAQQLSAPWPALSKEFALLRQTIDHVILAEQLSNEHPPDWRGALEALDQAMTAQPEPKLEHSFSDLFARCQDGFATTLFTQITTALAEEQPDLTALTHTFSEIDSHKWIPVTQQTRFQALRQQVVARVRIDEAAQWVAADRPLEEVLEQLREARKLSAAPEIQKRVTAWEALANAQAALADGDIAGSAQQLTSLESLVATAQTRSIAQRLLTRAAAQVRSTDTAATSAAVRHMLTALRRFVDDATAANVEQRLAELDAEQEARGQQAFTNGWLALLGFVQPDNDRSSVLDLAAAATAFERAAQLGMPTSEQWVAFVIALRRAINQTNQALEVDFARAAQPFATAAAAFREAQAVFVPLTHTAPDDRHDQAYRAAGEVADLCAAIAQQAQAYARCERTEQKPEVIVALLDEGIAKSKLLRLRIDTAVVEGDHA